MAFVAEEEDDEKKVAEPGQPGEPLPTSTPAGTLNPSGGANGQPSGANGQPSGAKPGGSFQGITSYLARNKPAAQRVADNVAGVVRGKGDAARNTLTAQRSAFDARVGENEVRQDAGLQNQILTDPTALSKNTADAARVKSMRDAEYKGPKTFEETEFYQPVSAAYGDAQRTGDLTNTAGGRMELIAGTAKPGSRITKGRLTLDEALLSGDTGARDTVFGARDSLSDLNTRLQEASTGAQTRATEAANTTQGTRDAVRGALGTSRANWQNDLDSRLEAARTEATNRQNAVRSALQGASGQYRGKGAALDAPYAGRAETFGDRKDRNLARGTDTFSDQALADAGLDRGLINEILGGADSKSAGWMNDFGRGITNKQEKIMYGNYANTVGDLSRFMTAQSPEAQLYRENVANTGDYDRLAALNDLSGEESLYLDPTQIGQAGTANLDLTDFDLEGLSKAYQGGLGSAQGYAAKTLERNARSGGDSFLKKHGASIATGGLVRQGGKLTDIGDAMKNPMEALKNLVPEDPNKFYYDPAQMFTDRPMPGHEGLDYKYNDEELV